MAPEIRYAKSGDVHIAYQAFGTGPVDLVIIPGFISNIEHYWDWPEAAHWLNHLAGRARVILFDKRGTGLSDRLGQLPGLEQRKDDARAVMDAAGVERAAVMGVSEGGSLAVLFAAAHPERCSALVLYGAFARFSDWFPTKQKLDSFLDYVDTKWGTGESLAAFAPSKKGDMEFQRWWGRWERLGGSPSAVKSLMRLNSGINIDGILPSVRVPTLILHRTEDPTVSIQAGRFLASHIPHAKLIELEGPDHMCWFGDNATLIADTILDFVVEPGAETRTTTASRRVLTTILFTDIVASTERARELGDKGWRELLQAHDATVRREIMRFRGNEIKSTGDGFLVDFDGPARAIRCAMAIMEAMAPIGIQVRAGLHTGEVERSDGDVLGIAVHLAARIMDTATAGEVVVSRTVKDLVAGSGIELDDAGEHFLRGLEEKWQLFRVRTAA
ncbi:adenylate/guanylate cyclase domain-containing protein [Bradyrhizobium sp. AUGA SZCCT0169]|uniref:adenylate/guanylate cyclase domain-containing protein n=1 Tax=unclassified Bradyrhizobium TaxID=2631580 RepID=UPI001BA49248|nr:MULTISPECIES: adenylate/guanylate cyclase domain-containing protein [unclassified Bradyrhizobium]MBR1193643.1 adenylate/guanylate cyclase domain-containing protein [Bradyrhizobium sp. AUGA SZCCT0160]MBR1250252.1 adenylate/guanylate cyclase domain-containing protein [Bradyrhizobium sp. AUGA SZCCT0169]